VGHDDGGHRSLGVVGQVQPAAEGQALGVELDIASHRDCPFLIEALVGLAREIGAAEKEADSSSDAAVASKRVG
jgi:hypothetical protein